MRATDILVIDTVVQAAGWIVEDGLTTVDCSLHAELRVFPGFIKYHGGLVRTVTSLRVVRGSAIRETLEAWQKPFDDLIAKINQAWPSQRVGDCHILNSVSGLELMQEGGHGHPGSYRWTKATVILELTEIAIHP